MSKDKASDVPTLREALEAIADGEGDAVVIAQQALDANPVADASGSCWRAECTECVGTGCSQTEAPCSACGGSGNVPGSEWRDTPQAAMADHPATRLEALQAQPVGEDVFRPNAPGRCSGCGFRKCVCPKRTTLTASPPVVEREAIARIIEPTAFNGPIFYDRAMKDDAAPSMRASAFAKADAILALTPVEGVGEREAKPSHLSVIPVRGHPEKHAVFDAIMGDAIAVCPDEIAAQRVFDALTKADATPVAAQEN